MARTPLLAVLAFLALVAPAQALPPGNVIVNGDAEGSAGATGFNEAKPPAGWSTTGAFTAVAYSTPGSPTPPPGGGANYFAGGVAGISTAEQTVDLAAYAAEFDAQPGAQATLAALFTGYGGQTDAIGIEVFFLNDGGGTLGSGQVGPFTPQVQGAGAFIARDITLPVPAGTRAARILMTATRGGGDYNDGYADNVSLTFSPRRAPTPAPTTPAPTTQQPPGPPPPAFGPSGVFQGLPPATKCLSKRRFTINVRNRGRTWRTVLVVLDGKSVKVRKPSRRTRNHHQSVIDLRGFPKRKVVVRLTAVSTFGEVIQGRRTYHTCESFKRKPKRNRL
jgi:hypothetical protein